MMEAKNEKGDILFRQIVQQEELAKLMEAAANNPDVAEVKVTKLKGPVKMDGSSRNQPCICGSGKKFKKCCGNPAIGNEERSRKYQAKHPIFINSEMSEHKCTDSCCHDKNKEK